MLCKSLIISSLGVWSLISTLYWKALGSWLAATYHWHITEQCIRINRHLHDSYGEIKILTAAIEGTFVASGDGWVTSAPTIIHGIPKQGGLKNIHLLCT